MSESRFSLIPVLYLVFLVAAIMLVYKAFTLGYERGEYRGRYDPPVEQKAPEPEQQYDLRALRQPTDELVREGRQLYQVNCASCHGAEGRGEGSKAAGLNPPPRNFHDQGEFKQGTSPLQLYETITNGIAGTSMASFSYLNPRERFAIVHYISTMIPDPAEDPQEMIDELPVVSGAGETTADAAAGGSESDKGPVIDLDRARDILLEEQVAGSEGSAARMPPPPAFTARCGSCHGSRGGGASVLQGFAASGDIRVTTPPLSRTPERLLTGEETFANFITERMPGLDVHGFAELTREEVRAIYEYLRELKQTP